MTLAIRRLERRRALTTRDIDEFLDRHSFPLLEGNTATFAYRGPADEVHLKHWIFGLPSGQPFRRLKDTDLWYLVLELPENSRVEYKFNRVLGEDQKWILDPLNPNIARDPFGANSVCQTAGYETPEWTQTNDEARPGEIRRIEIHSSALRDTREVQLYLPPRWRELRRYPLLIVHDGSDFLRYASLQTVLDNLIYRFEIPPLFVALTDSSKRLREYAADRRHSRYLTEELLPLLEDRFPIDRAPSSRGLMGASFGGVASLATAWHYPGTFSRLLLQSGSFAFSDIGMDHSRGPTFDPVVRFMNRFREKPGRPADKIFMSCGIYESLIYENRSLLPMLQSTGMAVRYEEARDGHNWENWRDRLRTGLSWLFPGPLWMVYE
ncbi:MAG: alpha/beta hydrolase-fold protein [Acidobacteriota bacterium]